MDDREHCRRRAYTERKRDQCRRGEARRAAHPEQRRSKIVAKTSMEVTLPAREDGTKPYRMRSQQLATVSVMQATETAVTTSFSRTSATS